MKTIIILGVYALLLFIGGYFGFKKGSKISLIVGVSSGVLVLIGLILTQLIPHIGWLFLIGLNVALSLSFISRLIKTRKLMPSGILLITTLAVLTYSLFQFK